MSAMTGKERRISERRMFRRSVILSRQAIKILMKTLARSDPVQLQRASEITKSRLARQLDILEKAGPGMRKEFIRMSRKSADRMKILVEKIDRRILVLSAPQ